MNLSDVAASTPHLGKGIPPCLFDPNQWRFVVLSKFLRHYSTHERRRVRCQNYVASETSTASPLYLAHVPFLLSSPFGFHSLLCHASFFCRNIFFIFTSLSFKFLFMLCSVKGQTLSRYLPARALAKYWLPSLRASARETWGEVVPVRVSSLLR